MHQKSFAPVNEKPSGVNGCARVDHIGDGVIGYMRVHHIMVQSLITTVH